MAVGTPVFLDTSVLLGGIIEVSGPDAPAQRVMGWVAGERARRVQTAWHCCLEFYSVATRLPEEFRLTPEDAGRLLEAEILDRLSVFGLPSEGRLSLLRLAVADAVTGGRIYDAHIAEVARVAGARTVVTENRRHFVTLLRQGITVLTSDELADELGLHRSRS